MKQRFKEEVMRRIEKRPYLHPVFSHIYDIPRRVNQYDPSFFIVFNQRNQKYEVHSLDYPGDNTISCTIPHEELDERTLHHIWLNDIRVHGKEIFRRLEWAEQKREMKKEKELQNFTRDFAKEHQNAFAKDAWNL
jgi:hypothetical protein